MDNSTARMTLSRREALFTVSVLGGGAAIVGESRSREGRADVEILPVTTLHAVAEAIYPPGADLDRQFISRDVRGRLDDRDTYADRQVEALATLDDEARRVTGRSFADLSVPRRRRILRGMGVDRVAPAPDGTAEERIRHYVIDDLILGLFTSPRGGALLGCDNPPGHPGGREAYQRRPV